MCVMRPDRVITARMQHILIDYYNTKGTKGGGERVRYTEAERRSETKSKFEKNNDNNKKENRDSKGCINK